MNLDKFSKSRSFQAIFIIGIVLFTIIALNLSIGLFTIIIPIFAAFILFLIFQVKD